MAQPTASDVHVDTPLSNIATAYKNPEYIGDQIAPRVPVTKQSDKYYIWTKDFWFRMVVEPRTPGDTYPEGGIEVSSTTYHCDQYHLAYAIPDEVRENQDPAIQIEVTAAEWLADQFALHREYKISAELFTTSVWGRDRTGTTHFVKWSDFENSVPLEDVDTGLTYTQGQTGRDPNVFVVGREVFDKLKRHPNLLDIFKYTGRGILTQDMVAQALGVPKLLVGNAIYTASLEGASSMTYTRLWGKHGLLVYVPPAPGLRIPAAAYTFEWTGVGGAKIPVAVTRWRDDARDRLMVRGKYAFDDKAVGTDLGYFFSAAVA